MLQPTHPKKKVWNFTKHFFFCDCSFNSMKMKDLIENLFLVV